MKDVITGTIDHIKKWNGSYFFIKGDNGVRYWSDKKYVTNANEGGYYSGQWMTLWDACAFTGAKVQFEITEEQTGATPTAVNVVLERIPDPHLEEKLLRKQVDKENRERHEMNRKRNALRQAQKESLSDLTGYVIQQRVGDKWANVYRDDALLWARDVDTAKAMIAEIKEYGEHYRLVKAQFLKNYTTGELIARPISK
jgi:hypothetical protein